MDKFERYLYDDIGNQYERKNLYIKELAILQEKFELSEGEEKTRLANDIKKLKEGKSKNTYLIELKEYKKKADEFEKKLKIESKNKENSMSGNCSREVKKLKIKLFESEKKIGFYSEYFDLTYDAELIVGISKIRIEQIPAIIKSLENTENELAEALEEKEILAKNDDSEFTRELEKFKLEEKNRLKLDINSVKEKKKNALISSKAEENAIKELNRKSKQRIEEKAFESKKIYNKELVKNKKYELKKGFKSQINILNVNESDIRRNCPIEIDKMKAVHSYVSWIIPGLGQLLNKQLVKSVIFFIGALFMYGIAVPYSLGYGNYRGEGIAGLLSLAEGGGKLDKSIIFMIEGIVAILFVIIGLLILYLAYKDSKNVETKRIKGIRERSWFETKSVISEDGFPYLVNMPALIVIVFIVLVPIITTILLSFTNMDPDHQSKYMWLGLENYKMLAFGQGLAGSVFWKIFGWTIIWTLCSTTLAIGLGFGLAILVNNERVLGKVFFRSVYLLPWAVPAFITILFFSIMFSPDGALTEILYNITGERIWVKNDPLLSKIALILIQGWLGSAYVFLLSTGVLQSINKDLYEAGDIDGASSWKKLTRITVPMVLFQTAPLLIGQYTFNFNNFSIIYMFNGGGPFNPSEYGNLAGTTDLLISYVYKLTMENDYQSIGAAVTVIISLGLMFFAYLGFRKTAAFRKEGE